MAHSSSAEQIINLNVGGHRFATSRHTLTWIPDSFFTSLLSGRIPTVRDESGAVFIDRDPEMFRLILNYLRTKQIDLSIVSLMSLKHEAQFYGLGPLVKRLTLCEELDECACGDVLFHAYLAPPSLPIADGGGVSLPSCTRSSQNLCSSMSSRNLVLVPFPSLHCRNLSEPASLPPNENSSNVMQQQHLRMFPSMDAKFQAHQHSRTISSLPFNHSSCSSNKSLAKGNIENNESSNSQTYAYSALNNSAQYSGQVQIRPCMTDNTMVTITEDKNGQFVISSPVKSLLGQTKKSSFELTRQLKNELSMLARHSAALSSDSQNLEPFRVRLIRAQHNSIAVGYANFVCCYRLKESLGWQLMYTSPRMDALVRHVALNTKFGAQSSEKMLAVALANNAIHLWNITEENTNQGSKIGTFSLSVPVDKLFFIGSQLVALSKVGKVGIWHSMTHNWQVQDVVSISCYDTAGSFLLLGCTNGSIYYIDMQKFPLRMKDNDLLITELYRDPNADVITAISVYLTPKTRIFTTF